MSYISSLLERHDARVEESLQAEADAEAARKAAALKAIQEVSADYQASPLANECMLVPQYGGLLRILKDRVEIMTVGVENDQIVISGDGIGRRTFDPTDTKPILRCIALEVSGYTSQGRLRPEVLAELYVEDDRSKK